MKKILYTFLSAVLLFSIALNLTGCAVPAQAKNLMEGITPNRITANGDLSGWSEAVSDFSVRLMQECQEDKNVLLSPLSVLYALSMTANGAEADTRAQMEKVLGMPVDRLNAALYSYESSLHRGEKSRLHLANSIWFTDQNRFTVNREFLQTVADCYRADIYQSPFNGKTLKEINGWVKKNTDGRIPKILDKIPEDAVMYLVNALAFEAEWAKIYEKDQVHTGRFTLENGEKQEAEFMHSAESRYLEDGQARGFLKYYKGGQYAFAALLPKEGVSLSDYIRSLDGKALHQLLKTPQKTEVDTAIPKFETEYSAELAEVLSRMGMDRAFSANAEFQGLGTSDAGNIFISRVLHKTFLSVGEKGTKAGAATVVEMEAEGCPAPQERKEVLLTRPFLYLLIDCENQIPLFMGTMKAPGK